MVTFYLKKKKKNRTKTSLTQLSHYCFEKRYYFGQKMLTFCEKMMTSPKLRGLALKVVFSETKYECVLTCQS